MGLCNLNYIYRVYILYIILQIMYLAYCIDIIIFKLCLRAPISQNYTSNSQDMKIKDLCKKFEPDFIK